MKFLEKLREREPGSDVAFHLEGLLEASEKVRSLLGDLGEVAEEDREIQARKLTLLQVEIYSHLGYHLKELRRPLRRLESRSYRELEKGTRRSSVVKPGDTSPAKSRKKP